MIIQWKFLAHYARVIDVWCKEIDYEAQEVFEAANVDSYYWPTVWTSYNNVPGMLGACKEARKEGLKYYRLEFSVFEDVSDKGNTEETTDSGPISIHRRSNHDLDFSSWGTIYVNWLVDTIAPCTTGLWEPNEGSICSWERGMLHRDRVYTLDRVHSLALDSQSVDLIQQAYHSYQLDELILYPRRRALEYRDVSSDPKIILHLFEYTAQVSSTSTIVQSSDTNSEASKAGEGTAVVEEDEAEQMKTLMDLIADLSRDVVKNDKGHWVHTEPARTKRWDPLWETAPNWEPPQILYMRMRVEELGK